MAWVQVGVLEVVAHVISLRPNAQYLRFLFPKSIEGVVLGTTSHEHWAGSRLRGPSEDPYTELTVMISVTSLKSSPTDIPGLGTLGTLAYAHRQLLDRQKSQAELQALPGAQVGRELGVRQARKQVSVSACFGCLRASFFAWAPSC